MVCHCPISVKGQSVLLNRLITHCFPLCSSFFFVWPGILFNRPKLLSTGGLGGREARLLFLNFLFAIDIAAYAVMSIPHFIVGGVCAIKELEKLVNWKKLVRRLAMVYTKVHLLSAEEISLAMTN